MEWKNANEDTAGTPAIGFCACIRTVKWTYSLYLGRESLVHDLYGRCIFWTELPKRPKAYFKLMGRNE